MWAFGETVVVHRRTGVTQDGDGNDVPVVDSQTYHGVAIGPGSTFTLRTNQFLVDDRIHAYWVPWIELSALDRIEVLTGGYPGLWDCDGEPKHFHHPATNGTVTDVAIKRVTG